MNYRADEASVRTELSGAQDEQSNGEMRIEPSIPSKNVSDGLLPSIDIISSKHGVSISDHQAVSIRNFLSVYLKRKLAVELLPNTVLQNVNSFAAKVNLIAMTRIIVMTKNIRQKFQFCEYFCLKKLLVLFARQEDVLRR